MSFQPFLIEASRTHNVRSILNRSSLDRRLQQPQFEPASREVVIRRPRNKKKKGKSLFDELPPLDSFPRLRQQEEQRQQLEMASLLPFSPPAHTVIAFTEDDDAGREDDGGWTPVPLKQTDEQFFVTTSVPLFEKDEGNNFNRPSRQADIKPLFGPPNQPDEDDRGLPAFGPPYHDDGVIAHEVNKQNNNGNTNHAQTLPDHVFPSGPTALPHTNLGPVQHGSFVSLDEPVSLVLKHEGSFPQKPFIGPELPPQPRQPTQQPFQHNQPFQPSQPDKIPEGLQNAAKLAFPVGGLDGSNIVYDPAGFKQQQQQQQPPPQDMSPGWNGAMFSPSPQGE